MSKESQTKTGFLTIAEAFSEKELFSLIRGAVEYVETLLEEKITLPFEDIFAELWVDEALMHSPKVDPYRLKQNQRSFVMRGLIWRLRDYVTRTQFEGLAVSLPDPSTMRRMMDNGDNGALLAALKEGAQYNTDSDSVTSDRTIEDVLEVAKLHQVIRKRTPTIWALMVSAGLAQDDELKVSTLTQVRKNLEDRMKVQARREGRSFKKLTKEDFAQHLKLEVRSFCRATDMDFDDVWFQVAVLLAKIRSSRGPYKTRQKSL